MKPDIPSTNTAVTYRNGHISGERVSCGEPFPSELDSDRVGYVRNDPTAQHAGHTVLPGLDSLSVGDGCGRFRRASWESGGCPCVHNFEVA